MQQEIEKIELVLENCEIITIEGKYIGDFKIENIQYSINRKALNYIAEEYSCSHFSLSAHRGGAISKETRFTLGSINEERNQYNRILFNNDITSIYIHFINQKTPKQIHVKWSGDSDINNEYQKSYINKFGDLFIVVDRNSELKDVFDLEEVEDEDDMQFRWSMYS